MKKRLGIFLCLSLIIALNGCGNNNLSGRVESQSVGASDIIEAQIAEEESKEENTDALGSEEAAETTGTDNDSSETLNEMKEEESEEAGESENLDSEETGDEEIDVDLTALSSVMVYSEVYNMMMSPDDYVGKTIKMDGLCAVYHDEATDNYYYACVITDATACCSQGIEFELNDTYVYPDDYPEDGDYVCVMGTFDIYQEGEYYYCTLRNASFAD
ncbi:MAG: hypothetical protein K5659_05835 [Lachnospiraceae bacterium]|nr:hypothetical protein [Lachnospiraceae bacterium]